MLSKDIFDLHWNNFKLTKTPIKLFLDYIPPNSISIYISYYQTYHSISMSNIYLIISSYFGTYLSNTVKVFIINSCAISLYCNLYPYLSQTAKYKTYIYSMYLVSRYKIYNYSLYISSKHKIHTYKLYSTIKHKASTYNLCSLIRHGKYIRHSLYIITKHKIYI